VKPRLFLLSNQCIGCYRCVYACSYKHYGVYDPNLSAIRIVEKPVLNVNACRHCHPAPCVEACSFGALKETEDGVILDEKLCNSCKACLAVCPFNALTITYTGEFFKCDLCGGDPECVKACPVNAIVYEEPPYKNVEYIKHLSKITEIYGEGRDR
jgi:carbon-monoxide dehydrogenase iron sulfur subunit